eukprot:Skav232717  [mRNA]  locus=scaffold4051:89627:96304:+ [translate_table: standard]
MAAAHAPPLVASSTTEQTWFKSFFLRWVRGIEQAGAHPGDELPDDYRDSDDSDEESPLDAALRQERGNMEALEELGGERLLAIYRPDPANTGRSTLLRLRALPTTTIQTLRRMILVHWPDLQAPPEWRLSSVHPSIRISAHVRGGIDVFLIAAQQDLRPQEVAVMVEFQTWYLDAGLYSGTLHPWVWPHTMRAVEMFHWSDQPRCLSRPCAVQINGRVPFSDEDPFFHMGTYIYFLAPRQPAWLHELMGNWLEQHLPLLPVPPAWPDWVAQSMFDHRHTDVPSSRAIAYNFQVAVTTMYRDIADSTRLSQIRGPGVLTLGPTGPVRYMRPLPLQQHCYSFGRDFPRLLPHFLGDLRDVRMFRQYWGWRFITFNDYIRDLPLPHEDQAVAVRFPVPGDIFNQARLTIIELLTQTSSRGSRAFASGDLFLLYLPSQVTRDTILQACEMLEECHTFECLVQLNGQHVTERGELHLVLEGSVLRVWFFTNWPTPDDPVSDVDEDVPLPLNPPPSSSSLATGWSPGDPTPSDDTDTSGPSECHEEDSTAWAMLLLALLLGWADLCQPLCSLDLPKLRLPPRRGLWFLLFAGLLFCPVGSSFSFNLVHRFGEAQHPGPSEYWIGTANPSGVRGKEYALVDLPIGLWSVAETQLSAITRGPAAKALKQAGLEQQRSLSVVCGSAVPLRARSRTAGQWAGVLTFADLLLREVSLPWAGEPYRMGRLQVVQAWHGPYGVLGATVYGYPKSPTWPKALAATRELLDGVVREIGLSATGPRYIAGDFNHDLHHLPALQVLFDQGWRDLQHLAFERHGRAFTYTCKGSTITDHILLSPELVSRFVRADSWDVFADHAALGGLFHFPSWNPTQTVWTMPAKIPWDLLDRDHWQQAAHVVTHCPQDSLQHRYARFSAEYEASFDGHLATPGKTLPPAARGRGQRLTPEVRPLACPLVKATRPGEIRPASDILGRTVYKWFQQVRRLQSMVHALRANKQTLDAQLYRASLWRAIRFAKGFQDGWEQWWATRPTCHLGLPRQFPTEVPTLVLCEALYADFLTNYKKFESWHLRHRHKLLQLTYQEKRAKVFNNLKPPGREGLQYLERTFETRVARVSEDGTSLSLDDIPDLRLPATLHVGAMQIFLESTDLTMISVDPDWLIQAPQPAKVIQHLSTPPLIHDELQRFWGPRWWKDHLPPPSAWDRIAAFACAYLPSQSMDYKPISVSGWSDVVKKFTSKSARGPDGYDNLDLQWMPDCFRSELVQILQSAETFGIWPQSLLQGFVHSLPKEDGAVSADRHRPIIIYSQVYRGWSSLRARALLLHVQRLATSHQLGFLPGCEPADLWALLQGLVESDHQRGTGLLGYVTDLRKAFETLPREPIRQLALHFGAPKEVIELWHAFLSTTERRFLVQGDISAPLISNIGYPEGCALSCVAMSFVGLTLHAYLRVYAPGVVCLSFVDNLEVYGSTCYQLQWGITCLQTWIEMWHLELDLAKTYTWGTHPSLRDALEGMGHRVERAQKDLGAQLVYGKGHVIAEQRVRLSSLDALWPKLRATPCPEPSKWMALQQAFWQRALYGIAICPLGWQHLKHLRTEAMRALGYKRAGASPALRLFLLCPEQCDPGFYQLWTVFNTFLRLVKKHPGFYDEWELYMHHYGGQATHGPFAKLLEQCRYIGWSLELPGFYDHDGVWHSFFAITPKALYSLLCDAWTWVVWGEVQHRKDFNDSHGLDRHAIQQASRTIPALQKNLIKVLQDGTFQEPKQHAKYDLAQTAVCPLCQGPDSMEHRLQHCPALSAVRSASPLTADQLTSWPYYKKIRCLASANPWYGRFRALQCEGEEVVEHFPFGVPPAHCDLFTDGSSHGGSLPDYALASWAVVCPARDHWVVRGALVGLHQTADRAELRAGVAAIEYAMHQNCSVTIWSDSTYFAAGLHRLLLDPADVPDSSNEDLWQQMQALLAHRTIELQIQHVASHRPVPLQDYDIDDWTARWNRRADHEAGRAMQLHPAELRRAHGALWHHHRAEVQDLQRLQALHLAIYDARQQALPLLEEPAPLEPDEIVDAEVERECPPRRDPFGDAIFEWQQGPEFETVKARYGMDFSKNFMSVLGHWATECDGLTAEVTFLELAIYLGDLKPLWLPRPHPAHPNVWVNDAVSVTNQYREPTVALLLRLVRSYLHFLSAFFNFDWISHKSLLAYGVHVPQSGLHLCMPYRTRCHVKQTLASFTRRRLVRVANDLARPIN